jgi:hypothetical protein
MRLNKLTPWFAVPWAALVSGAGCARRPPPAPVEPPLRAVVTHRLGSPVDPPVRGAMANGDAVVLRVRGYAADASSLPAGESLTARGRLIIDSTGEPVATAPPAAEAVRLVTDIQSLPAPGGKGKAAVAVTDQRSPIPAGCSASVAFFPASAPPATGADPVLRLTIVSPSAAGGDRPRLLATARGKADAPPTPGVAAPQPRERSVLLDWPLDTPTGEFALVFPGPSRRGVPGATVFRVAIEPANGDPQITQASALVLADLSRVSGHAAPTRGQLMASSLSAAPAPHAFRTSLATVCAQTQADVTTEALLLLDDKALASITQPVVQALGAAPADADPTQLGWLIDRAVLGALAKASAGGEAGGEVRAMLSARFGEVGRDASAVADLAAASPSRTDFDTRVRAENVIRLDDASPASRVRAFDWMARREAADALKGYDPMAPAAQRRNAIEQYLQQQTSPATQPATRAADASGGTHE